MKRLDATVGRFCASLLPTPSSVTLPFSPKNVLVIRPGGIGDAALLAPALIGLKRKFPHSHLTVLAERRNAGVLQLVPEVDAALRYDVLSEFVQVFQAGYDVLIDTEQYHRLSAVVGRMVKAGLRIGFATNERERLFNVLIPYSHDDYEAVSFGHLLVPLGIECSSLPEAPFLSVPLNTKRHVDTLLASLTGYRLVVLFPGASIPERRWGTENFAFVAAALARRGFAVVVVGGVEDKQYGDAIVQNVFGVNLAGQTSLAETAAVLERAALLISGDSGVLHIGVGLGLPTVSLFGSGIARKWGPQGDRHVVLNKAVHCSPCTHFGYTKPCQNSVLCLRTLSPQEALTAAFSLLKDSSMGKTATGSFL